MYRSLSRSQSADHLLVPYGCIYPFGGCMGCLLADQIAPEGAKMVGKLSCLTTENASGYFSFNCKEWVS